MTYLLVLDLETFVTVVGTYSKMRLLLLSCPTLSNVYLHGFTDRVRGVGL